MAVVREKLLTASDLAALCEVDLKTIHNWVDRGRIPHFRTPGRHLRFRAADVAEFLRAWGYSVPRELARATSKSVLVVGNKDTQAHVSRALGEAMSAREAKHPYDALIFAGSDPADVYVVDARAVASEIDVAGMVEAIHRASPQAMLVALVDESVAPLPAFVTRVPRSDPQALRQVIQPEPAQPPAPAASAAAGAEEPRGVAAGGSSR